MVPFEDDFPTEIWDIPASYQRVVDKNVYDLVLGLVQKKHFDVGPRCGCFQK